MAIQVQGNNGTLLEVGGLAFRAGHMHVKPIEYGSLGHYRAAIKIPLLAGQVANARLFELRNSHASNLIIPTRVTVSVLPFGSVASPYFLQLELFRCTGFSAVDTAQTTTPTISPMRTGMAGAPGSAQVRYLSGATGGMSGGTLTKDATPLASLMAWMASVSATSVPVVKQMMDLQLGEHPLVCAQNEGFVLENANLGSATSNQVQVNIEVSWAEVSAY